jgi:hypothetical protein
MEVLIALPNLLQFSRIPFRLIDVTCVKLPGAKIQQLLMLEKPLVIRGCGSALWRPLNDQLHDGIDASSRFRVARPRRAN